MLEYDEEERDELDDIFIDEEFEEEDENAGRLSPHAKEDIYQLYN